jgi:hypothetical protein
VTAVAEATIEQRVEAGAAWLDEHRPGWWKRTDLTTLHMELPCFCVLGQEYGSFYTAPIPDDDTVTLGFDAWGIGPSEQIADFAALNTAWATLIELRRAEAGEAP